MRTSYLICIGSVYSLTVFGLFYLSHPVGGAVVSRAQRPETTPVSSCKENKGEHRLNRKAGDICYCENEWYTYGNKESALRNRSPKIGFVGDTGARSNAKDTLDMFKDLGVDLVVHLGDLDYEDDPNKMEDLLDDTLGPNFPVLYIIGNHDINNWTEYIALNKKRIEKTSAADIYCEGNQGVSGYCIYKGVFIEMIGYGTLCDSSQHLETARRNLQSTPQADWRVCAWHKVHSSFQLGSESTEVSLKMYNTCIEEGAIVMTGHNHSYGRTKPIRDAETKSVSSSYSLRKGKTLIFLNGVGGRALYSGNDEYYKNPWWDITYTATSNPRAEHGGVVCTFKSNGDGNCKYIAGDSRHVLDDVSFSIDTDSGSGNGSGSGGGSSGGDCIPSCPECTKSWEDPVSDGCDGVCPTDNCSYNQKCSSSAGYKCVSDPRCAIRCLEQSGNCLQEDEPPPTNWCGGKCDNIPLCKERNCRIEEIEVCE